MNEIFNLIVEFRVTKYGNILYTIFLYTIIMLLAIKISDYITTRLGNRKGKTAIQWRFLKQTIRVIIIIMGLLGMLSDIPSMDKVATTIVTSSSIIVVAIGLAAQESMANAINGMFITIFKPFVVGDRIRLRQMNIVGTINDINLRHTVIKTFENNRIIIPNTVINKESIENFNYEDSRVCNFVDFIISFDSDIDKATRIIQEEIIKHQFHIDVRSEAEKAEGEKEVSVYLRELTDRGVNLRVGVWTEYVGQNFTMCSDIRKSVFERYRTEGIKIAIPMFYINEDIVDINKFKLYI